MRITNIAKKLIKLSFNSLNYELKPISKEYLYHVNAWQDQKQLLINQDVSIIFDIGANTGQTAQNYRKIFKEAKIFCFEPFEEAYSELLETTKHWHNVEAHQLAISESKGTKAFYFNKFNPTNSLLPIASESKKYVKSEWIENLGCKDVNTTTLDYFCQQKGIESIDILKMDIQGGELMALKGAVNLLKQQKIDLIFTEVLVVKLYEGQPYIWDIQNFLSNYNYVLYGLYDLQYGMAPNNSGIWKWADAIFISDQLIKKINNNNPKWGITV